MESTRAAIYAAVVLSVVVIPAYVTYRLVVPGLPPAGSLPFYVVAGVVFAPGVLMGGAGLLVAGRG